MSNSGVGKIQERGKGANCLAALEEESFTQGFLCLSFLIVFLGGDFTPARTESYAASRDFGGGREVHVFLEDIPRHRRITSGGPSGGFFGSIGSFFLFARYQNSFLVCMENMRKQVVL